MKNTTKTLNYDIRSKIIYKSNKMGSKQDLNKNNF